MIWSSHVRNQCSPRNCGAFLLMLALAATGCRRDEIAVYTAPKDVAAPRQEMTETQESQPPATPQITWTVPKGWRQGPGNEISLVSFHLFGEGGADAQVDITRLGNLAGREPALVNMWRTRVGQSEITEEQARKELRPVEVAGETGSIFEVSGAGPEGTNKIVTVILHHPEGSWFFKLSGDLSVVDTQRPQFLEFIKSVRFNAPAPATPSTQAPQNSQSAAENRFHWRVPEQWRAMPAGEMQIARFAVPGVNQAKADVFVSVFPNDSGGVLPNVNRWRGQVGLAPLEAKDLKQCVAPLDPANPDAILVDIAKDNKRLIASIVPRDGRYWFYKLMGDATVVGAQRDSFVAFAKSQP